MRVSAASCGACVGVDPSRRAWSSRRPPARRAAADGPRPALGPRPADTAFCLHPGLFAHVRPAVGLAVDDPDLGRAARTGVSPTGRHGPGRRPRQPTRGGAHPGHLRPDPDSSLPGRAGARRGHRAAAPCRDPDRTGTVEARIGHAQKTPLKGLRFETRIGAQAYLDRWETRWADTRIHGTTNRQVAAMFAEERPALGPLPLEPFRDDRHGVRTVHLDGCVEVEAASYSAPPGWIGQRRAGAVGRGPGAAPGPHHRGAPPGASPLAPRLAAHPRRGPAGADAPLHPHAARPRHAGRARHWHPLRAHPPA